MDPRPIKTFAEYVVEHLSTKERTELLKKYKSRYGGRLYNTRGVMLLHNLKEARNVHIRDSYYDGLRRLYPGLTLAEIEEFLGFNEEDKSLARELKYDRQYFYRRVARKS